ncbi:hypothetical protein BS47DRAFT_1315693 [Hydnum rufescens UP504]|uniref:WD repeat-containing protein JIP5 n=1 Tax=Hydnum rufescens UP504 TaxID=1448309 RepID=A0A9P6DZJ5_9AGAM|nr:hypothetical protein BS47DRAFT_1315693 [Hydnum rufescens UP504]
MPDIPLKNQPFDLTFHPSQPIVYVGLLTGEVKAYSYSADLPETDFTHSELFSTRPTKRSCRGLATSVSGDRLYTVTKDKTMHTIDTASGTVVETTEGAHEEAINRILLAMPNMLATGDDDGVIKLWDPRKKGEIRKYTQHFDFISDFLWLEDKKHLVATSGDGTLSVMDVRTNKTEPFAHSEDQEDELLSITSIKGQKHENVVGTQRGILSIFNRSAGWGDCVDRVPGHPHSVDALYTLPASLAPGTDIIATGSSDGLVRLVQLFPTKVLGVVADHGAFPVERLKMDMPSSSPSRWLGSVSHENALKMTDLGDALEESDEEDDARDSDGRAPDRDDGAGGDGDNGDDDDDNDRDGERHEEGIVAEPS